MADAALMTGWREPKTGRESHAMELFSSTMMFWTKQMEAGNIESFEPVIMSRHGGDLNGFLLIRGEAAKLDEIRRSEEFTNIITQASYILDGFGVIDCYIGASLMDIMGKYGALVGKG